MKGAALGTTIQGTVGFLTVTGTIQIIRTTTTVFELPNTLNCQDFIIQE
ncbi:hypothetical protein ACFLS9_08380 [Bacteroidota bacterium]